MRKKYRKKKIKGIPFFYGYSFNGISNCKNCDVDRKTMVVPHPVEDQGVACANCGNPVSGMPSAVSESKDMKLLKEYNPMKAVFHFTPQNSKEITAYSDVSIENAISTLESVRNYIKVPELDKMIKCLTEIQSYGDAYESMSFLQMQTLKEAIRGFLDEVYSSGNYFPGKSELEEVHTMIEVMMELAISQDMEKIDGLKKEIGSGSELPMAAEGLQRQLKESVNFSDPEDINKIQQAIGGPMSDLIGLLRIINNETTREIEERIVSGDVFSKDDFIRYYEILENQLSSAGFADPSTNELLGKEYYEKLSELVDCLQELVMISAEDEFEELTINFSDPEDIKKAESFMGAPISKLIEPLKGVNDEAAKELVKRISDGDTFTSKDLRSYYGRLIKLSYVYQGEIPETIFHFIDDIAVGLEHEDIHNRENQDNEKELQSKGTESETMKESKTVKIKENSLKKMITAFAKQALKESPEDFLQGQEFEEEAPRSMEIPSEEIVPAPEGVEGALQAAIDSLYSCYSNLSTEDMMKINDAIEMLEDIKERSKV